MQWVCTIRIVHNYGWLINEHTLLDIIGCDDKLLVRLPRRGCDLRLRLALDDGRRLAGLHVGLHGLKEGGSLGLLPVYENLTTDHRRHSFLTLQLLERTLRSH